MREDLRNEIRAIYSKKAEGLISKEEYEREIREKIHTLLTEDPKKLLELAEGHIFGLNEPSLLLLARKKPTEFAYMNISAGAYRYSTVSSTKEAHPDSEKIKGIFRKILENLNFESKEITELFRKTEDYDDYNEEPAYTLLDLLEDENIIAGLDWKFGLEDIEYNLNLITKRLKLSPIKEYPPYREGDLLGYEALEKIIKECGHSAVILFDGDTMNVFLTTKEKAELIAENLEKLGEFWELTDIEIID